MCGCVYRLLDYILFPASFSGSFDIFIFISRQLFCLPVLLLKFQFLDITDFPSSEIEGFAAGLIKVISAVSRVKACLE